VAVLEFKKLKRILLVLLACLLMVSIIAYPVFASSQIIINTLHNNTSVWDGSFWRIDTYNSFGTGTFTGVGVITSVTNYVAATLNDGGLGGAAGTLRPYCEIGGVKYLSGTFISVSSSSPSSSGTATWATNPSTGLVWTKSQVDATTFGVQIFSGVGLYSFTISGTGTVTVNYTLIVPSVTTDEADTPTYSGGSHNVTLNGQITSTGGATPDMQGFAWSTTSNATAPGNIVPPATYTTNWTTSASGTGAFEHNVGSLTKDTTYYYRAYAHNSQGWAWGDEIDFTTLDDPSITTSAASQVTSSTARLNASVTDDGGQECEVRFLRGTATGVYTSNTTAVDGYTTGESPYVDISGLAVATTYYVRAEITNDVSTQLGAEITFTTESGVSEPTGLKAIPNATSVSLTWTKGTGSNKTLIMYKAGSYPTSKTDGTQAYFDTKSSTVKTGLTTGTTYYVMAWGETSGLYSTSNTTTMFTTLATTATSATIVAPPANDMWFQSPDYTNMRYTLFYEIVNFAGNSFQVPLSTWWYMLALLICVTAGIFFYSSLGNHNLFLSILVVGGMIMVMVLIKLVPLWNLLPFVVIALAGIFVGERR
jgi:hypothetical protein